MSKIVLKIKEFFLKSYLTIYMITILFAFFFYFLLKAASGHKFIITSEEKIYSIILFLSFILSGFYKTRKTYITIFDKLMLYLLLAFSLITLLMCFQYLYFTLTFDFDFWGSPVMITFDSFLLPMIFIWCNFYLIKNLIKELSK